MPIISKDIAAKKTRILLDAEVLAPSAQATTNSYVDVADSELDAANYRTVAIGIVNGDGANSLDWKVLGSIDGSTYYEAQAEATVTFGASGSYSTTAAVWRYYKVQVKSTVLGDAASATVSVIGK